MKQPFCHVSPRGKKLRLGALMNPLCTGSAPVGTAQKRPTNPPLEQAPGSTGYGALGRSSYRQQSNIQSAAHNLTIPIKSAAHGKNKTTIDTCAICNEDPGHRLNFCNTLKRGRDCCPLK